LASRYPERYPGISNIGNAAAKFRDGDHCRRESVGGGVTTITTVNSLEPTGPAMSDCL